MIIPMEEQIKHGVSAHLFGQKLLHNGGHSLDPIITDTLPEFLHREPFSRGIPLTETDADPSLDVTT